MKYGGHVFKSRRDKDIMNKNEYLDKVPLIIRNACKVASDDTLLTILVYLLKKGDRSVVSISSDLSLSKKRLKSDFMPTLMRYGMVYTFYTKNDFGDEHCHYEISNLGKKWLHILINSVKSIPS